MTFPAEVLQNEGGTHDEGVITLLVAEKIGLEKRPMCVLFLRSIQ